MRTEKRAVSDGGDWGSLGVLGRAGGVTGRKTHTEFAPSPEPTPQLCLGAPVLLLHSAQQRRVQP